MEHRIIIRTIIVVSLYACFLIIFNIYTAETGITTQPRCVIEFFDKQKKIDAYTIAQKTFELLKRESTVLDHMTTDDLSNTLSLDKGYIDEQTFNLGFPLLTTNPDRLHEQLNQFSPEDLIKIIRTVDYLDITRLKRPLLNNTTLARLVTYCKQNPYIMGTLPMVAKDSMLSPFIASIMNNIEQIISEMTDQEMIQKFGDTLDDKPVTILQGHTDRVRGAVWSFNGKYLATASDDKTTRIWNTTYGSLMHTKDGSIYPPKAVALSPDNSYLAIASCDGTARISSTADGTLLHTLPGCTYSAPSVAWCPDSKYLAIASAGATARIWNATNGTLLHTLQGHANWVESVAWSPDGKYLATASADGTTRIWNVADGAPVHTLHGHTDSVNSAAWSSDSRYLATASDDTTARIWNIALLEHIAHIMNGAQALVAWSIIQQPPADIATSILEILPTQLINILITKAGNVSEQLEKILQKRDKLQQAKSLEKFRQRILEQKEKQPTEQQTKHIMSGKEEYYTVPHRMPGTRIKSLPQPKYKSLD